MLLPAAPQNGTTFPHLTETVTSYESVVYCSVITNPKHGGSPFSPDSAGCCCRPGSARSAEWPGPLSVLCLILPRLVHACPPRVSGFRQQELELRGLRTEPRHFYHILLAKAGHKAGLES